MLPVLLSSRSAGVSLFAHDRFFRLVHLPKRRREESPALHSSYHLRRDHRYPSLFTVGLRVHWPLRFHGRMMFPVLLRNHGRRLPAFCNPTGRHLSHS